MLPRDCSVMSARWSLVRGRLMADQKIIVTRHCRRHVRGIIEWFRGQDENDS
ncbi:hypothetical protein WN55_10586 [Dufourea novaeangliae]|uniref:Uncharacterized protein n=1 Tax=Dufourea novaeangliae TaxID=178035 RepID=A0A154P406_DUFNO|nr:hypothetical protein WN55_10586 [Dufourea novaeangliae]